MSHDQSSTTKLAILISRVFPLPFVIMGAVMLYTGGKEIYLARESMTWPSVDGTILNSTVEYDPDYGESPSYKTGILYSFMVNEHARMGRKVTFGDTSPNYCDVQTVVNRYPTGAVVKVHYRANDPDTCILEPGLEHGHFWARPGYGLFLFVPMSLLAVYWPKLIRQKERHRQSNNAIQSDVVPRGAAPRV
jgi:hypothetical protein